MRTTSLLVSLLLSLSPLLEAESKYYCEGGISASSCSGEECLVQCGDGASHSFSCSSRALVTHNMADRSAPSSLHHNSHILSSDQSPSVEIATF